MTGRACLAGLVYVGLVFLVGVGLGTARTLLLEPSLGRLAAVALEVPIILLAAWWVCVRLLRRPRPFDAPERRTMAAVALASLLLLEAALGVLMLGRPIAAHLAAYATPDGVFGLAAQLVFASFPLVQSAGRSNKGL